MNEIKGQLFQLHRFQILALYTNEPARRKVTDSYAYAWSELVAPSLDAGYTLLRVTRGESHDASS